MKKIVLSLCALVLLVFNACSLSQGDDGRLNVVTTVGMAKDMIENIGGDKVVVQSLMGPGVDPHLYKPTASDIGRLETADVVFYVGLHLEGKMVEIFESLAKKKTVVALSDGMDISKFLPAQAGQTGAYDPHVWFDVELWASAIGGAVATLSESDPENADFYKENGKKYSSALRDLDVWVGSEIAKIPKEQRLMITAHDAFNYFGRAYDIDVRGIQGISTASDYGLKDLENLIDLIVEKKVKALFVESSVPKKSIEALREGVIERGWDVQIGGQLYSDAMGDPGSDAGNYVGMVKSNVNTIVNALK